MHKQIRSKLLAFGNPLSRFTRTRNPRQVESQSPENASNREIYPRVAEEIDELANPGSASTSNERSAIKSNTSVYQAEHHPVAHATRTRESYQDLAGYFSEVDPDEPTTSATNITVHSASTFDRDAERTESSENPQSTTVTSSTSMSFDNETTETMSSSLNTEEASDTDLMDALQRGTIAMIPMGVAFSAQLGTEISGTSQTTESRTQDQRISRDDPREFYDRTLRMMIRKPICPPDDEPSIY
ncbi:hypothetical protein X777_08280 [Ooceraea biroi]|uniref:Uncharacterized protein n=1 Tax=Ooceraea biroi TaxID=2015173 RepID=A0A026WZ25_OOCBI|nr:hypothetical protein X777_08280 [Ooceraea biroi]